VPEDSRCKGNVNFWFVNVWTWNNDSLLHVASTISEVCLLPQGCTRALIKLTFSPKLTEGEQRFFGDSKHAMLPVDVLVQN